MPVLRREEKTDSLKGLKSTRGRQISNYKEIIRGLAENGVSLLEDLLPYPEAPPEDGLMHKVDYQRTGAYFANRPDREKGRISSKHSPSPATREEKIPKENTDKNKAEPGENRRKIDTAESMVLDAEPDQPWEGHYLCSDKPPTGNHNNTNDETYYRMPQKGVSQNNSKTDQMENSKHHEIIAEGIPGSQRDKQTKGKDCYAAFKKLGKPDTCRCRFGKA
jgi:hypothetical protein